jgi:hypothetical protein
MHTVVLINAKFVNNINGGTPNCYNTSIKSFLLNYFSNFFAGVYEIICYINFRCTYFRPSMLQNVSASFMLKLLSQIVPHVSLTLISARPSKGPVPSANRASVMLSLGPSKQRSHWICYNSKKIPITRDFAKQLAKYNRSVPQRHKSGCLVFTPILILIFQQRLSWLTYK